MAGRWLDLDGLRGLAAAAIVLYHVGQPRWAAMDFSQLDGAERLLAGLDGVVDFFFVVSAFLLTLPFVESSVSGADQPRRRVFLVRRAVRILPAYVVAVTVVWCFRNPVLPGDLLGLGEHLLFLQTFDRERIFFTIGPAWSLAVEVQFVVILVALVSWWRVLCRGRSRRRRLEVLAITIGGLAAFGILWRVVAWYVLDVSPGNWPVWFGVTAKLDVFAVGMALALVRATGYRLLPRAVVWCRLLGVALVLLVTWGRPWLGGLHLWYHGMVAVGWGCLLAAAVLRQRVDPAARDSTGGRDRWTSLVSASPLVLLGSVSYGLYLWHEPVLLVLSGGGEFWGGAESIWLRWVLVLIPSIVLGWLSHRLVERPTRTALSLLTASGRGRDYYGDS